MSTKQLTVEDFRSITADELSSLYNGDGLSDAKIGEMYGVSGAYVSLFRKNFGIPTRKRSRKPVKHPVSPKTHKKHGLDEETLRKLYLDDLLTDTAIGGLHGLSDVGVSYLRKKHGIRTITNRERTVLQAKRLGFRDISSISREELSSMYERHGLRTLAKMFGCSKQLVTTVLEEHGVAMLGKTERLVIEMPEKLTDSQYEVLYGSLLGDGCMRTSNGRTARYSEKHCNAQKGYLEWKNEILKPFSNRIGSCNVEESDGRISYGSFFNTCNHPIFMSLYSKFYDENGVKHLPDDFERMMTPMVLACWYQDDGHLADRNSDGVFTIASGLPESDVTRAVDALNTLGLDAEARKYESSSIHIIFINNKDRFHAMISPHIHPVMEYKMPVSLRRPVAKPKPVSSVDIFRKLTPIALSADHLDETVELFFAYFRSNGFPHSRMRRESRDSEMKRFLNSEISFEGDIIPHGVSAGTGLCQIYFKNFWEASRIGRKSPMEVFNDDRMLKSVIRRWLERDGREATDAGLRSELASYGGVHSFRPVVAREIIDAYCPVGGVVLDPCAGWGGRLLGFIGSEASRYVGIDVNSKTCGGLRSMGRFLIGGYSNGKTYRIECSKFERFTTEERFDLAFTSPPYFNAELYGGNGQSCNEYPEYDEWMEKFAVPLVERSYGMLNPGGRIIINVANTGDYPVADDFKRIIERVIGVERVLLMEIRNRYTSETRYEPVFVSKGKL